MIIERKYEWFGMLYESDPFSKAVIDKAFLSIDDELKKELFSYNHYGIPAFFTLGCGIPGECYSFMMEEFEKLDKSNPYDNKLTFNDVTRVRHSNYNEGKSIQIELINEFPDMPYRIVGHFSISYNDGIATICDDCEIVPTIDFS